MSVARGKATDFSCVTTKNITMKGANFLEKLLDNQPVEWKKLGEVAELKRGKTITQKEAQKGNFPVISGGQKPAYYINQFNREGQTITIAGSGAYAGFVQYWEEPIFVSDAFSIKANEEYVLAKFIYHFLLNIQDKLYHLKRGSGVPHVYAKDVAEFPIPIPPLSVQSRIVEILDKFTSLEAELEAELDCRKRQYIYYRELLLDFSQHNNIQWKKLGEVCEFQNGFAFKSSLFKEKGLPIIRITNISGGRVTDEDYKYFDSSDYPKRVEEFRVSQGDILIAMSGATTGKIGWYDNEVPAYLNQRVGRFIPNSDVLNNRFLYHYLQMKGEHLYLMAGGGAQPNLSSTDIKEKFPIPLPPLSEQARIVEILDKFDTLTNSISEGLPLEIQLRRQQYEYYREQLLAFPHS